jgi:hypothetical protein
VRKSNFQFVNRKLLDKPGTWNLTFVFYCIKVREDFLPMYKIESNLSWRGRAQLFSGRKAKKLRERREEEYLV